MADTLSSPATIEPNIKQPESDTATHKPSPPATTTPPPEQQQQQLQSSIPIPNYSPNPNQTPSPASLPLPPVQSYVQPPQPISVPPSYRPVPIPQVPQFSPVQSYQSPCVLQPPGVGVCGGVGTTVPPPIMSYPVVPDQVSSMAPRPYAPMPNGCAAVPAPAPGSVGVFQAVACPPVPGIPGVRPIIPPVAMPVVLPTVTPSEKPQTTIYVGKIAPTADNEFMLSVLQVCGPVKNWKRAQDPSNGSLKGFGFYEFESAEGVLRALRLLNRFNIEGQELLLNVNQETKEYLVRYVQKKTENTKKLMETQDEGAEKENETVQGVENNKPTEDLKKHNETIYKENNDSANFGIVTDEDREADREALEKLTSMIEERIRARLVNIFK